MKNETKEYLKNYRENEWTQIKGDTLDEFLTATYIRALQPDCFEHYHFQTKPYPPDGWDQEFREYKTLSNDKKAKGWANLKENYHAYISKIEEIDFNNDSNKHFLKDMLNHFTKLGLSTHAMKVKTMLLEYA